MIYINHDKFVTLAAFLNLLINQFFLFLCIYIYIFFFLTNIKIIKISKDSEAKYYQDNKEGLQKSS